MLLRWSMSLVILLMPLLGRAQTPTRLDGDDVYFQFAGVVATDSSRLGTHITSSAKPSSNRLCGFSIRGNHRSRANPHVEWDLNIDEIVTPDRTVAGVSAGTFDVKDHKRRPRPAITQLSFALRGVADPIIAQIQGAPNADNGVVALLEAEPASRLFAEFQTMRPIVISLRYSDGSTEQLEVRGWRDSREFGRGKNSYLNECLRGFRVPLGAEITGKMP
jgi:hypothetical protein